METRSCNVLIAVVAVFILPQGELPAAPPDFCLKSAKELDATDPIDYSVRANGRYCDGIVYSPHNVEVGKLGIAGISCGSVDTSLPFDLVTVTSFDAFGSEVRLLGMARVKDKYYRLDAEFTADQPSLRLDDHSAFARQAENVDSSTLGWQAWYESDKHGRVHVPVANSSTCNEAIVIRIRPDFNLNFVRYTARDEDGAELIPRTVLTCTEGEECPPPIQVEARATLLTVDLLAVGHSNQLSGEVLTLRLAPRE